METNHSLPYRFFTAVTELTKPLFPYDFLLLFSTQFLLFQQQISFPLFAFAEGYNKLLIT